MVELLPDEATIHDSVGTDHSVRSRGVVSTGSGSRSMRRLGTWYSSASSQGTSLSDKLPDELLRGVPLRNLLAGLGEVIRVNPDTLPERLAAERIHNSRPVRQLECFVSHCWLSHGWHKYITLLLHFLGDSAFLVGGSTSVAVLCVQRFHTELPHIGSVREDWFDLSWSVSVWEMFLGLIVASLILLVGHLFLRRTHVFLDCACIHQTDVDKKAARILNLSTYLRKSDELIVLWDPIYFTRGWCGYELASYLALNPSGRVRVLSLACSVEVFFFIICLSLGFVSFLLVWPYIPGFIGFNCSCALSGAIMGPGVAVCGEAFSKSLAKLKQQLDSFDIRLAEVTVEADHERILEHIDAMYPSGGADAFNNEVRTSVRRLVVREFGTQRSPISYRMTMLACYPTLIFYLSLFSGMRHATLHFQLCVLIYAVTFVLFAWPPLLSLCLLMGLSCARQGWKEADAGLGMRHLAIGFVITVMGILGIDIQFYLPCCVAAGKLRHLGLEPWSGPWIGLASSALWFLFSLWLFFPLPVSTRRQDRQLLARLRRMLGDFGFLPADCRTCTRGRSSARARSPCHGAYGVSGLDDAMGPVYDEVHPSDTSGSLSSEDLSDMSI